MSIHITNTAFQLSEGVTKVLGDLGFKTLTPIQEDSFGPLLLGKDLVGQAQTGSGKTVAFTVPILEKIITTDRNIQAIVLCPTRELSAQVTEQVRKLGRYKKNLIVVSLVGGTPFRSQMKSLEHGAHIIVGTPGRILDHLERKTLELSSVKTVVLDEADRMLDMGFKENIEQILLEIPENRQTVFFSATFPTTIEALSKRFQQSPVKITAKALEAPAIEERIYETKKENKLHTLISFLATQKPESAIVFCNTKLMVDEISVALSKAQICSEKLHGDLEQADRQRVMAKFRNRSVQVLIATDVAARGIDVTGVETVINYDLPSDASVYVHRIGRTGRIGKVGLAVSLLTPNEMPKIKTIEQYTNRILKRMKWEATEALVNDSVVKLDTLYIGAGRKQKIRPTDILGALTGLGGCKGEQVGKIEILDNYTYVAINSEMTDYVVSVFKMGKIKNRKLLVQKVK